MNREQACRILGVEEKANLQEIKKKYRALIRKAHPDAKAFNIVNEMGNHSAQELNEAYEYLCDHPISADVTRSNENKSEKRKSDRHTETFHTKKRQKPWKASENLGAYRNRKIFYEVRDEDNEKIGEICVAEGKYYWIQDEDFTMFLKSMFILSKEILDEIDEEQGISTEGTKRLEAQAELSYLLSAQFLDGEYSLRHLSNGQDGENQTYHFNAMLETNGEKLTSEDLFPKRISGHKLYIQDANGTEVGYLSFYDDRLYYALIPLFEQRLVQVKIKQQKDSKDKNKRRDRIKNYINIDLWIRFVEREEKQLEESINIQIEKLLLKYRQMISSEPA